MGGVGTATSILRSLLVRGAFTNKAGGQINGVGGGDAARDVEGDACNNPIAADEPGSLAVVVELVAAAVVACEMMSE